MANVRADRSLRARSLVVACVLSLAAPAAAKDPQLVPNRLSSTGDSITEAVNAEEFDPFDLANANPWASWANGYYGYWEWLFGRTDVQSHNQRITAAFGDAGRTNFLNAVAGANAVDLAGQAAATVAQQATYTTMLMGHNDVCGDDFSDIPTDAEFEADVRAALDQYVAGLPTGATVYIVGMADIYGLWALGDQMDALGILPCELLWATALFGIFPCATMLSPANSEADRLFTRSRNIAFNDILRSLALEYEATDPQHHYLYTSRVFETAFTPSQISDFDCFHPSAEGQQALSAGLWEAGPFPLPEPAPGLGVLAALPLLRRLARQRAADR